VGQYSIPDSIDKEMTECSHASEDQNHITQCQILDQTGIKHVA